MSAPELEQILAHAKSLGLSGRELAEAAGLCPETVSRLRRAADCRLGTVKRLAAAAGLKLELRPRRPDAARKRTGPAARLAARKLSAGRRREISAEQLVAAIRAPEAAEPWTAHLHGLLEELPVETLHDIVLDGDLGFADLLRLAERLDVAGETAGETLDWLEEMAGDGVAQAA